jgi:hypothetical protein
MMMQRADETEAAGECAASTANAASSSHQSTLIATVVADAAVLVSASVVSLDSSSLLLSHLSSASLFPADTSCVDNPHYTWAQQSVVVMTDAAGA